jgi:hypothetical protein
MPSPAVLAERSRCERRRHRRDLQMAADLGAKQGFNHRQLPVHGELDAVGLVRAILATGYQGPFGCEVFSIENTMRAAVGD